MNQKQPRRKFVKYALASAATGSLGIHHSMGSESKNILKSGPIDPSDNIKVTKLETFVLKNSWVFVKISTDAGIVGWGEMLKDDAKAFSDSLGS